MNEQMNNKNRGKSGYKSVVRGFFVLFFKFGMPFPLNRQHDHHIIFFIIERIQISRLQMYQSFLM